MFQAERPNRMINTISHDYSPSDYRNINQANAQRKNDQYKRPKTGDLKFSNLRDRSDSPSLNNSNNLGFAAGSSVHTAEVNVADAISQEGSLGRKSS